MVDYEKFKCIIFDNIQSGDYRIFYKNWQSKWKEATLPYLTLNFENHKIGELVAVHKKHNEILNAFFENKCIEIKIYDGWSTLFVDFIYSYNRVNEYRIKEQNKSEDKINNSDYNFYKQTVLKTNYTKG